MLFDLLPIPHLQLMWLLRGLSAFEQFSNSGSTVQAHVASCSCSLSDAFEMLTVTLHRQPSGKWDQQQSIPTYHALDDVDYPTLTQK